MQNLREIRRQLHRIPEPGFQEFKTQQFLLNALAALPQERLEIQTWRTGLLALVKGLNPKHRIGYRTDMDGLPIQEQTSYDFASVHPGFMHACGHDVHMTIALGVLEHFLSHAIDDDLLVVFQPAEEGPGGARPMLESTEFAAWRPNRFIALHIAPEYPVGTIATRPGILFANTSELYIDLVGQEGHAAFPHKANDMVVAGAHLISQLQSVISRNVDPIDAAVITVGKLEAGTKQNIIAGSARLEGTIRALSTDTMKVVKSRIEDVVRGIEIGFRCKAEIEYGANYRQVYNHPEFTQEFMEWVQRDGAVRLIECREAMTGEDFGYFLDEIPGFMFWLGVDTPYGLHNAKLEPNEAAIEVAVDLVTRCITWMSTSYH